MSFKFDFIHYQTPRTAEIYIHRSGRTARAQRTGLSVLLVSPADIKNYKKICFVLNRANFPEFPVNEHLMHEIKQRVNLARSINTQINHKKQENHERNWKNKILLDMEMALSDEEEDEEEATIRKKKIQRDQLLKWKYQLAALLKKDMVPLGLPKADIPQFMVEDRQKPKEDAQTDLEKASKKKKPRWTRSKK